MSNAAKELETCQKMCNELREEIKQIRSQSGENVLLEITEESKEKVEIAQFQPTEKNECTGHFGKIYSLNWSSDSNYIVTASQDGKLIVWKSYSGNKTLAITLNSAWVMTCAFSPKYDYIASGGLDNTVSIFKTLGPQGPFKLKELSYELEKHDGYLSCARFLSDKELISASGDGTCILWEIEKNNAKTTFQDHTGDVMSIALNGKDKNLFVSGSVDATAKIWDIRTSERCVANFPGHEADINTVQWFPDGKAILTGSDDGTVRMFDFRSYRQLSMYVDKNNKSLHSQDLAGVTSVDCSITGSYIFAAYDNGHVFDWNSLALTTICDLKHESRVSSLGVSPNGYAVATGCWDFNLRIFA